MGVKINSENEVKLKNFLIFFNHRHKMAAMLSFLVPVIFFGFNGNLFKEIFSEYQIHCFFHKKRPKKFILSF